MKALYIGIVFAMNSALLVKASEQCSAEIRTKYGKYLSGHVISTKNASNVHECVKMCSRDIRCRSMNFHLSEKLCDLNDADRRTHPEDYRQREGSDYIETDKPKEKDDFKSCAEIQQYAPQAESGYYKVKIGDREAQVYCDMDNHGTFRVDKDPAKRNGTVFYQIPSGHEHFNSSCVGAIGTCPRIIISYSYPYQWETNNCTTVDVGYRIGHGCNRVFDGVDNNECGRKWTSSQYNTTQVMYGFPCPGHPQDSLGIFENRDGMLYVK